MHARAPLAVLALSLALTACASGGSPSPEAPSTAAEVEAVKAVVLRLFEGMRLHDAAMVRSVFHPDARFVAVAEEEGRVRVSFESAEGFVAAVGRPGEPWNERVTSWRVEVDGRIASVWAGYTFHLGETFSHCGVDSFELVKGGDGWVITQGADTRQRTGCPGM